MSGSRRLFRIAAAVATTAAMTLAGAGIAIASSGGARQPAGQSVNTSPAKPMGTCHLWAVVRSNGTLARTGCRGTTSRTEGSGAYQVLFPVTSIRHCAYVASIGIPGNQGSASPGFVTVAGRFGHRNGVFIATYDKTGSQTPSAFHLVVAC